jgi:hypothetical protein
MLSDEDCVAACRNIGFDLTCGACAGQFYTGSSLGAHTCPFKWGIWFVPGPAWSGKKGGRWLNDNDVPIAFSEYQARLVVMALSSASRQELGRYEVRRLTTHDVRDS